MMSQEQDEYYGTDSSSCSNEEDEWTHHGMLQLTHGRRKMTCTVEDESKSSIPEEMDDSPLHSLENEKYGPTVQRYISKYLDDGLDMQLLVRTTKRRKEKEGGMKTIKAATTHLSSLQAYDKSFANKEYSSSVGESARNTDFSFVPPSAPSSDVSCSVPSFPAAQDSAATLPPPPSETQLAGLPAEVLPPSPMSALPTDRCSEPIDELDGVKAGASPSCKLAARRKKRFHSLSRNLERSMKKDSFDVAGDGNGHGSAMRDDFKKLGFSRLHLNLSHSANKPPTYHPSRASLTPSSEFQQERMNFYKHFSATVRMEGLEKQRCAAEKGFSYLNTAEDQVNYQQQLKQCLWLELKARHAGCSLEEYEKILSGHRQAVLSCLEKVMNFSVQDNSQYGRTRVHAEKYLAESAFQMDIHKTSSSATWVAETKSDRGTVQTDPSGVPGGSDQGCISSDENRDQKASTLVGSHHLSQPEFLQNALELSTPTPSAIPLADEHKKRKISIKQLPWISESSGTDPSNDCDCSDTLSRLCQNCIDRDSDALEQVSDVLEMLDQAEHLYPCTAALREEHALYCDEQFVVRMKTLTLWANVTRDIRQKVDLLAKMFNIRNKVQAGWPCYESHCSRWKETAETKSGIHRSECRRALPRLVQFGNPPTAENSPSTSISDSSDYSRTSVPASPDVQVVGPFEMPGAAFGSSSPAGNIPRVSSDSGLGSDHEETSIYKHYVDKTLRHKGLRHIYQQLGAVLRPVLYRVHAALKRPTSWSYAEAAAKVVTEPPMTSKKPSDSFLPCDREHGQESAKYGVWSPAFRQMMLPTFHRPFLFLLRVPLDVVHECLRIRVAQQPEEPSPLSISQLIRECKEVLRAGIQIRQRYVSLAQTILGEGGSDVIEAQLDAFDEDLKNMLQVYLRFLGRRMLIMNKVSQFARRQKSYLEEEWSFVRSTCPHIPGGEALAANKFCFMAVDLLAAIGDSLEACNDDCITSFDDSITSDQDPSSYKKAIHSVCRNFKNICQEMSERTRQAICFAKTLRKDLEIATEFKMLVTADALLQKLKETGHIRVVAPLTSSHVMFVPGQLQYNETYIWQLVDMTCGHETSECSGEQDGYLIMMHCENCTSETACWTGPTIVLEPTAEATITLSHVEVCGVLLVVNHSSQLMMQCRKFQRVMSNTLQVDKQQTSCNHAIAEALSELKGEALELRTKIVHAVRQMQERLDLGALSELEEADRVFLHARCREVVQYGYKLGFEYQKAVTRLITGEARIDLGRGLVEFAHEWTRFVMAKCEKGRGQPPRWASQGLEFLITACEPQYTQILSEEEYMEFKSELTDCVAHLVGTSEKSPSGSHAASPSHTGRMTTTPGRYRSASSRSSDSTLASPFTFDEWAIRKRVRDCPGGSGDGSVTPDKHKGRDDGYMVDGETPYAKSPEDFIEHVRKSIELLEARQQQFLASKSIIGRVSDAIRQTPLHVSARRVTFPWQRGFKIGEGRFGKVYTAVNNLTGELIAMKEIRLQPNDRCAVKAVIDELRIFEGIKHPNLVRYYGVEIHREEMLIFMEYCKEGSLETVVQLHLPETLIRKYTRQLLEAVNILHEHGIVHRDIKSANIFLTVDGLLKLGDFGCSIKLKNHTTLPGELVGFVGTPAYMAPEVFMKTVREGHGRAVDIWSVGCVVLEMASGQRPWHDLENSYQIMFRVGMGEIPDAPDTLGEEGRDFLGCCLQHDPRERWTASQLLGHPFTKVAEDDDS